MSDSFARYGPAAPDSPVVVSVPHAGRDYPLALRAALAVPVAVVAGLEDRYADRLALAAREGETLFVAGRARAWIDLNRGEDERDPLIDDGARGGVVPPGHSKLGSGLGLIPRRGPRGAALWRRRFADEEVRARITADHRPYHDALAAALAAARARFGVAVLLDLHSMPPLASGARLVLGDRFGRSAADRFTRRLEAEAAGHPLARNTPYAGGHVLARHGDPAAGVHALQLEIDRTLYLDRALDRPGAGFEAIVAMLRRMIAALADEALGTGLADAAE